MTRENSYLKFVTNIEKIAENRTRYHIGDRFILDVTKVTHDLKDKHDFMNIWKRMGYIKKPLPSHIVIDTYYTDSNGNCWGYYNITTKRSDDGKRKLINFDYLMEHTPENVEYLVNECIRLREMDVEA